jgi:hypothetical protein
MRLLLVSTVACLAFVFSCGRHQVQQSKLKVEIAIPASQINSVGLSQLTDSLQELSRSGRGVVSLASLLSIIPFTAEELAQINAARDDEAAVTCVNSICTGTNSGTAQEIDVSQMNLPNLGVPHVAIGSNIMLKFRIDDAQLFDVCSIEGFSVKKFFIWTPLVAAKVTLNSARQAVSGVIIGTPTSVTRCN